MPTYDQEERFRHEYHRLRRADQLLFKRAVKEFVAALKEHRPPPKSWASNDTSARAASTSSIGGQTGARCSATAPKERPATPISSGYASAATIFTNAPRTFSPCRDML